MALEACSFQLYSSTAPAATPLVTRASTLKEKNLLNLLPNRALKQALSSSFSSSSIPFSTAASARAGRRQLHLICQATNTANEVVEVNDDSWEELVLGSEVPALVEFWAPSCGPCRMVEPVVEELAKEYAGKIACFKVNTDGSLKMASKYGIRDIPTVLLFKDGEKQESITGAGAMRKSTLSTTIDKYLQV